MPIQLSPDVVDLVEVGMAEFVVMDKNSAWKPKTMYSPY